MCEPVSIGLAIMGAVSSLQQGAAASAAAQSDADIAGQNAILAQRKADDTRVRGKQEARAKQLETLQLLGLQRAAAASAGVSVTTADSSITKLTEDTAQFGKLDELRIVNNAEREALGFEGKASIFLSKKDAAKQASKNATTAGFIGAGTSLLGSANTAGFTGSGLFGSSTPRASNFGTAGGGPGQFRSSGL